MRTTHILSRPVRAIALPGLAALLATLAACGDLRPHSDSPEWPAMKIVVFEACVPDKRVPFEVRQLDMGLLSDPRYQFQDAPASVQSAPRAVNWVEIGAEPGKFETPVLMLDDVKLTSASGFELRLSGSTTAGQPVYRATIEGDEPDQYRAVGLIVTEQRSPYKDHRIQYWFKVPTDLREQAFTPWTASGYVTNPQSYTFYRLLNGQPLDATEVPPPDAPRLRFMAMRRSDFWEYTRRSYASRHAAYAQYAGGRKFEKDYVAAPIFGGTIPPC